MSDDDPGRYPPEARVHFTIGADEAGLRSERAAIEFLVADRVEAGLYSKVEGLVNEHERLTEEVDRLKEILAFWE